jgi:hypothetical protein
MSTVEQVALWAGLISSIVSVVLSIVAIAFAVMVDRSARAVTAQTIKSLQKIESDVERLSSDTRELIKAGWDRMLGSVQPPQSLDSGVKGQMAAGIAAELKSELAPLLQQTDKTKQELLERRLQEVIEQLQSSLTKAPRIASRTRRSSAVDAVRSALATLSPEAVGMVALMTGKRHLESREYRELREGPLAAAVRELRRSGLLAPQVAGGMSESDPPVYFFPGALGKIIPAALPLLPPLPRETMDKVMGEMKRVGYPVVAA